MPTYRVSILQQQYGQLMMNVLHYDVGGAVSPAGIVEIADDIRAKYVSSTLAANLSSTWAYIGVEVRRVDLADQPSISVAPTAGVLVGTGPGDPLPTQIACLVSGTALTAFPRRVRTYIPGVREGSLTAGLFATSFSDRCMDFVEAIDGIAISGDLLDRVAVRYGDEGDGPIVTASNSIATYSVTAVPATQRRRRIGVGS